MQAHYDVVILGGGLAGLTLARQLRAGAGQPACPGAREAHPPGARSRPQGRRIERRDRGSLLRPGARPQAATWPSASSRSSASATSSTTASTAISATATSSARARFPRIPSYQLDRGRLENFLFEEDQRQGVDVLDRAITTDVVIGDPSHTVHFTQAGAPHTRDLPLGGRRHRASRLPQGQVRPAPAEPAQGQCHLVAGGQAAQARRLDHRRGLAGRASTPASAG